MYLSETNQWFLIIYSPSLVLYFSNGCDATFDSCVLATKEYPYSVILYIITRVICIYIIDNTSVLE